MNLLNVLRQLRDDIKIWVTNNINALNAKIDEKTIPIDGELSSTSTNPVQNKVIKDAIDNIPTFSGDYNDLTNAPDISEDGSGNMIIADESGNIIFKADAEGIHTTAVSLNGEAAATETYVDNKVADLVNSAPEALNTLGELATALETHEDAYDALLETVGSKATHTDLENLKEEMSESIVSETDEWKVVDENGNIIFSVDADGAHTTSLTLNGNDIEAMIADKANEIYIGDGDMPEGATIQLIMDAVDEEELLKNEITEYIDSELTKAKESGEFRGEQGPKGDQGPKGNDGYTPVKGTDYWTASDQQAMVEAVLNALPIGEEAVF